jgi:hypothetical protein
MPITGFVSSCLGIALPSTLDLATIAWVNAVVTNGGTVSAGRQTLVNNLIVGGKSDGWWAKMDRLWIYAGENQPSALTDMVAFVLATLVGASPPTFTTDYGFNATGTGLINLLTNLSTYGGQFTTNSGHISAWSPADIGPDNTPFMGVSANSEATDQTHIYPRFTDGNTYVRCNEGTPGGGFTNASGQGHYVANRDGASTNQSYKNGSLLGSPNLAAGTIPSLNVKAIGVTDTTLGNIPSNYSCSQASIGGNLSATDVSNFYNRLRTYMTAVGVP